MNDPFIRFPLDYGDIFIRRSQVVMLESEQQNGKPYCHIYFRLGDHTTSRRIPWSCEGVMDALDRSVVAAGSAEEQS